MARGTRAGGTIPDELVRADHSVGSGGTAASATAGAALCVIVFSKDRAFQLGEYLRTLLAFGRGALLDIHVLYRAEPDNSGCGRRDFVASYARVQAAFPSVNFVREVDFAAQVCSPSTLLRRFGRPSLLVDSAASRLYAPLLPFPASAQGARGERGEVHSLWRRRCALLRRPAALVRILPSAFARALPARVRAN